MDVTEAQREVRMTYIGGFPGHLVIGVLWILSAGLTTWISLPAGAAVLVIGGFFIYPLTQLVLRLAGRPGALSAENPLRELAIETAFIIGPLLPMVGAASLYKASWFYPGMMLVVGAHYLPFAFLYGMRHYLALAALLIAGAIFIAVDAPQLSTLSAWAAGVVFIVFAVFARAIALKDVHGTRAEAVIA